MNIFVVNGPNLNLLGTRQPEIYGRETLDELIEWLRGTPDAKGHHLKFYQSNHEGDIIDALHLERTWATGILINPGAFTHTSYAIRDAISAIAIPAVEIHLSDIQHREPFRKKSVISPVCVAQVSGMGKNSYLEALRTLLEHTSG